MHEGINICKIFFQDLKYFTKIEFWAKIPYQKSQNNILGLDQFWSNPGFLVLRKRNPISISEKDYMVFEKKNIESEMDVRTSVLNSIN